MTLRASAGRGAGVQRRSVRVPTPVMFPACASTSLSSTTQILVISRIMLLQNF